MAKYQVEFNFIETKNGDRFPMELAGFKTRKEAEEFAEKQADAKIIEFVEVRW